MNTPSKMIIVTLVAALLILIGFSVRQRGSSPGNTAGNTDTGGMDQWIEGIRGELEGKTPEQQVELMFNKRGMDALVSPVLAMKKNAIELVKAGAGKQPVTGSKIGGLPAMKPGAKWPEGPKGPLGFLFQVNLSDASKYDTAALLPDKGLLLFFYDDKEQPWGFEPESRGGWKVLYYPDISGLRPAVNDAATRFKEAPLLFSSKAKFPEPDSESYGSLGSRGSEVSDLFSAMQSFTTDGTNYLLGYPMPVQNPGMEEECQLASNGIYTGDKIDRESPKVRKLLEGTKDWILLAQLDSDYDAGMMWGDAGMLYFWIRAQDLRERDFSKVWLILQCY